MQKGRQETQPVMLGQTCHLKLESADLLWCDIKEKLFDEGIIFVAILAHFFIHLF